MAKQIIETFVDDLDGSTAERTTKFALDGENYEIDLSAENADKLHAALAPFIIKARKVVQPRSVRAGRGGTRGSAAMSREKSAEIRQWAKAHGLQVSERGRISSAIVEQYEAAH
ncbi:Lsr2 family protein [Nonomuraea sp. NPDC049152]|uniref:histone-like nucleoid-structuring protein Lsr2 n=1 Tax=Nonomuraea sp. NPDC049152 TaxID=3154350 RepID=UPI0033CEF9C2